jgi:hypothetical protein
MAYGDKVKFLLRFKQHKKKSDACVWFCDDFPTIVGRIRIGCGIVGAFYRSCHPNKFRGGLNRRYLQY